MTSEQKKSPEPHFALLIDNFTPLFYNIIDYLDDGSFFALKRTCKTADTSCKKYATRIHLARSLASRFEAMPGDFTKPIQKLLIILYAVSSYSEMFKITDVWDIIDNGIALLFFKR